MRQFFNIISRLTAAACAVYLLGFGFFGFSVAAMAGVEFPIAHAIAMSAATAQAPFLAWLSSGPLGFGCFVFAIR